MQQWFASREYVLETGGEVRAVTVRVGVPEAEGELGDQVWWLDLEIAGLTPEPTALRIPGVDGVSAVLLALRTARWILEKEPALASGDLYYVCRGWWVPPDETPDRLPEHLREDSPEPHEDA